MSAAAAEAARLGPLDAWAMIALGCCRLIVRDHAGALAELRAAVEAEPCATLAHGTLALALAFAGETEEALAAAAQARRINPYEPRGVVALNAEGVACILSGRYAQGLAAGNRLAALRPGYPSGPGIAAAIRGPRRYRGAAAIARLREILPGHTAEQATRELPFASAELTSSYVALLRRAGARPVSDLTAVRE